MLKRKLSLKKQTAQYTAKSAAEQDLHLWNAASQYMRGEIGIKDLENIERYHDPDLKKAVQALAKEKLELRIVLFLRKLLHLFRNDKASFNFQK